ncbi:hypothetical protein SteCoe_31333 [Stentor coeruleus]|uniref:Uncharacterized protein n=1 Tax=Stentor coeruleus TaxID=5963 RepID=A0A1R2B1I4_9CILI|nr:hypothetical protein SteCoe_31333 [Stentor coeruleus]
MSKSCRSPDILNLQGSILRSDIKSPKNVKTQTSYNKKMLSIKHHINDIVSEKIKVQKCIEKVQARFKQSIKKEAQLNELALSVETRMLNLEKRKNLLKLRRSNLQSQYKNTNFQRLNDFLIKAHSLSIQEKELEGIEEELNLRAEDFSFETRSSENTQQLSFTKDNAHKQFLKNTLCKIEFKEETISRHSSLSKLQKQMVLKMKIDFEIESRKFLFEKESFSRKEALFNIYKQQVLRKSKANDDQKVELDKYYNSIDALYKKNENLSLELKNLQKVYEMKPKFYKIQDLETIVNAKEEKIVILKDSFAKKSTVLKNLKNTNYELEQLLERKLKSIQMKNELIIILNEIEAEIIDNDMKNKHNLIHKQEKVKMLISQALDKEQEINFLEKKIISHN